MRNRTLAIAATAIAAIAIVAIATGIIRRANRGAGEPELAEPAGTDA
jgi:hypothetical protein